MRFIHLATGIALATASGLLPAYAESSANMAGYSTSTTQIATLLEDPAAKAVLLKHIPVMLNKPNFSLAANMTLKEVHGYNPPDLPDNVLAEIDEDLAKLPPKH